LEVTMTDGGVPWGSIPYDADEDNGPKIPYAISVLNLGTAPATGMILHLLLDGTLVPNGGTSGCGVSQPGRQQAVDLPQGFLDAQERGSIPFPRTLCVASVQQIVGTDPEALTTFQIVSQVTVSSAEALSNTSVAVTPYCVGALCTTFCPLR